jgi:hypothetical protein
VTYSLTIFVFKIICKYSNGNIKLNFKDKNQQQDAVRRQINHKEFRPIQAEVSNI